MEILVDDEVAAVLYSEGESGIKLTSAHMASLAVKAQYEGEPIPGKEEDLPPAMRDVRIKLDPIPYHVEGGKVVKFLAPDSGDD